MKRKAGAFLAKGADTCVYAPPVMCTPESGPDLSGDNTKVSRIIKATDPEVSIQDRLKAILATMDPSLRKYFMTYETKCVPTFREEDTTDSCATTGAVVREGLVGPRPELTNLVTKKFMGPLARLTDSDRNKAIAIRDLAVATLSLFDPEGNTVLHMDSHPWNIAVVEDRGSYHLTLNDWGRSLVVNVNAADFIEEIDAESKKNRAAYPQGIVYEVPYVKVNEKYWLGYIFRAWRHLNILEEPHWGNFCICINVLGILGSWGKVVPIQAQDIDTAYGEIVKQLKSGGTADQTKMRVLQILMQIPLPPDAAPPPGSLPLAPPTYGVVPAAAPAPRVAPPRAPAPDFVAINVAPGGRRKTRRRPTPGLRPRSGVRGPKRPRSLRRLRSRASSARSPPSAS